MRRLGKRGLWYLGLLCALMVTGCQHLSNTARGGMIGGGAGAGLGAAVGSASGNTGAGALVGGIIGTLAGGAVGNDIDQQEKRDLQNRVVAAEASASRNSVGIMDVIQMTRDGVEDEIIVNQIRQTNSRFILSTEDIRSLRANRVSQRVILEMQNRSGPTTVIQERPRVIYHERPVYVYDPYPPPPPVRYGWGVGMTFR